MYYRRALLVLVGSALLSCVGGCGDDRVVVRNIIPNDQARISGTLLAWRCGVGDLMNNNFHRRPLFGVTTKDTATIIIVYANGWQDTVYTDSLSEFKRLVSCGLHKFIVQTRYTWPADTIQAYISGDTALDLNIVYNVLQPDSIDIEVVYATVQDTLGVRAEWGILQKLSQAVGGGLAVTSPAPITSWRHVSWLSERIATWQVPLASRTLNVWEVVWRARGAVAADSLHAISPVKLNINPHGIYGCAL